MTPKFFLIGLGVAVLLGACDAPTTSEEPPLDDDFSPVYNGIQRDLLDVDLVNMRVTMIGARYNDDVAAYAECAVAQYALKRGYGFARHIRTNVTIDAGIWAADAVYTISATLPQGLRTIDAEITVQNCATLGIPTV